MATLRREVPEKLEPLLYPNRYKAAFGGRAGAKSHFFAGEAVIQAYKRAARIVCIREVQHSLKDSVRQLIVDKINEFGMSDCFDVLDAEIRGAKGTPAEGALIIFRGMQSYNSQTIKSLEGFDVAWVEEAQTLSEISLRMLRPTIRKEGSELWFSWNPRFESDPVDHFFRGNDPRKGGRWKRPGSAAIVEINWYDNPWLSPEILEEKDHDYAADSETAEHVWGGGYEAVGDGAYYARIISGIEKSGQVGEFPHVRGEKVYTSWDLGVDDYTSVWFYQILGDRVRVIDFFEYQNEGVDTIVAHCMPEYAEDVHDTLAGMVEIGREEMFDYQRHFLPHDIGMREWGAGARTRIHSMADQGVPIGRIHRGVAQNPEERINAVRKLLPICDFNATGRVQLGLAHLRRYSKKFNENLGLYMGPDKKGGHGHASDSFGEFAVNCGLVVDKPKSKALPEPVAGAIVAPSINSLAKRRARRSF